MKYEKSCGCVVFNGDKVLLVRQIDGHYAFPKGHVEANETEIETAIREVLEETNVHVQIVSDYRYKMSYHPKGNLNVNKDVVYFIAKPLNIDINPQVGEISEVKWIDKDKVMDILTYDEAKDLFKDVISYISKNNLVI